MFMGKIRNMKKGGQKKVSVTEQLGSGDGEHGNAYAEPTDLGEAQQEGGQVGALGTECTTVT